MLQHFLMLRVWVLPKDPCTSRFKELFCDNPSRDHLADVWHNVVNQYVYAYMPRSYYLAQVERERERQEKEKNNASELLSGPDFRVL